MSEIHGVLAGSSCGFAASLVIALGTWIASIPRRDVSLVDIAWPALVVAPALGVAVLAPALSGRAAAVLALALVWALRLASHIAWRHRGQGEDHRYQAIRARNEPHFAFKSLYLVFGLQVLLAWIVALPLGAAIASARPLGLLDAPGLLIAACGLVVEAVADAQLARFRADARQRGRVLAQGLWRYSRHPNYFGEWLFWWGLWLVALQASAWWTIVSPLLMSALLLRVSGVTLLERDIGQRRPEYRDYVARTNAFFPGRPRP